MLCLFTSLWLVCSAAAVAAPAAAHEPCAPPPAGMVCVPGGPAVLGDERSPGARPRVRAEVSTFYLDQREVTNRAYAACEQAGSCPRRPPLPAMWQGQAGDDQPAVAVSWEGARRFCLWAGKRLPSEAEWEKAARGGLEGRSYPWGEEPPSCERAAFRGCEPGITRPVGSLPPGAYDLHDLAGNAAEWVRDWASPCRTGCAGACGPACQGRDPLGPCRGLAKCPGRTRRLAKGGSFAQPGETLRAAARMPLPPTATLAGVGVRCASDSPRLTPWPPLQLRDPLPPPPDPAPPSAEELAIFRAVPPDPDVLKIPRCDRVGKATSTCRDPMTYLSTNEKAHRVWAPYIRNLGGGYVGLGPAQNYHLISAARSQWAWLFDYDPFVIHMHWLLREVALLEPDVESFVEAFSLRSWQRTRARVAEAMKDRPRERRKALQILEWAHKLLHFNLHKYRSPERCVDPGFGWLCNQENYRYVRLLFQQGRILAVEGNMLTDVALPAIARAAERLGVPVRVYYPSNAEEMWALAPRYCQNVRGLPFDLRSVVLRTAYSANRPGTHDGLWHYLVHGGQAYQRALATRCGTWVQGFLDERLPTPEPWLSVIRLPGAETPGGASP
ncbi:MAG TPA: SUMF1/EgtB/PvdO family nonheme iron enzyme [Myxococcota bacterium]|nr:SUMF1/EgtB/PvdO family nonheme iron enzyme [Myxococcota bacterium]HRY94951.1 SUMF1/EgtB/PvdO family nonheme iron enzyme [Myxococcota bacterium]